MKVQLRSFIEKVNQRLNSNKLGMHWHFVCFNILLIYTKVASNAEINDLYLKNILQNLNTTIEPCDDFYQFACGNWGTHHETDNYMDMPGYMDHVVNQQLLEILTANSNKSGIYEQVWLHYQACENLQNPALNYYLKIVEPELNFEWPIFREDYDEPWKNETQFDWLRTVARLRVYGLNGVFLTQNINMRLTNGSHYLLEVHQHQPRLELKFPEILDIFKNFGLNETQSTNVSKEIIALEERMKNLTFVDFVIESEDDDKRYKDSFKELTINELAKIVPQIDWAKYFSSILGRKIKLNVETVQTFALNVEYFQNLLEILEQTSNETICYYIMLKFMYHLNDNLPILKNKSIPCIRHLRGFMPLAMNFLYEEHIYKAKRNITDTALLNMFGKLRTNFKKLIAENFLELDTKEQTYIIHELETMQLKIGNIPENVTRKFVEDYYQAINMNASNFYANHLQLIKLHTRQQQKKLQNIPTPPAMQFYEHDPETASSSSPIKIFDNVILVPYGYLQLPLFDPELNSLFQYSLFGFIIAHEIIHAYDLFHIVYDEHGNYNEMGVAVAHHFWKYVDCFARHPSDSLSENIADVAGLRLVYQAYFDDAFANDLHINNELSLTASNFTAQQLFFINSVQFLCANMLKISALDVKTLNLEHDMHDVRVLRNWANIEQLGKAFQCANDTAMNPTIKCRLW